jgi:hypothetical protein
MHGGSIRLFDADLHRQLAAANMIGGEYSRVHVNGRSKYVVGDLPGLMASIQSYSPDARFPVEAG